MKTTITKNIFLSLLIIGGLVGSAKAQSTAYDDQEYYNNNQQNSTDQNYNQQNQNYNQQNYNQQNYNNNQNNQANNYQQAAPPVVQNDQQSFYYYPDANVYYDINSNRYIYDNAGSWLTVSVLPRNIFLGGSPRFMVYHRGPRVWMDNAFHVRNYYRGGFNRGAAVAFNNNRREDFGHRDVVRNDARGFDHRNMGRGGNFERGGRDRGGRR